MIVALRKSSAKSAGWIGRLIDALSGRRGYSHVELAAGAGVPGRVTAEAWAGFETNSRPGGYAAGEWTFYDVGAQRAWPFIANWGRGELGCGYDYLGVLRFILPFIGPSGKRWWCSEVVEAALHIAGLDCCCERWMATPNSLAKWLDDQDFDRWDS